MSCSRQEVSETGDNAMFGDNGDNAMLRLGSPLLPKRKTVTHE